MEGGCCLVVWLLDAVLQQQLLDMQQQELTLLAQWATTGMGVC
jgi:hypothetical protein